METRGGADDDARENGLTTNETPTDLIRCAEWSRRETIDPIGTAGTYSGYLLLEWPLPWPADLGEAHELAPIVSALKGTGIRLQGLAATRPLGSGRHVILYRGTTRPDGGFDAFERREAVVPQRAIVATAMALIDGSVDEEPIDHHLEPVVDLLICGHGRRDRCCGSLGMRLISQIANADRFDQSRVRLWRTSHTGGHRFAPTMVVLPEGTVWGFADNEMVERLIQRSGTLDDLLPRYRGCSGLGSPLIQALERAVLAELGWPLLGYARWGEEIAGSDIVRLHVAGPLGSSEWEGQVTVGRRLLIPTCGSSVEAAVKTGVELEVAQLRRLMPAG